MLEAKLLVASCLFHKRVFQAVSPSSNVQVATSLILFAIYIYTTAGVLKGQAFFLNNIQKWPKSVDNAN